MARNQLLDTALKVSLVPTNGGATSGAPLRYGQMTGVALCDVRTDGTTSAYLGFGAFSLLVDAHVNGGGGSAIAVGDPIFYTDALTNATHLSKDAAGYFFGFAATANAGAGTATTIAVLHFAGGGILGAGSIGSGNIAAQAILTAGLADSNVTAGKLTATLRKGFIPLALQTWEILTGGAIDTKANNAGLGASDTTPTLTRTNALVDPSGKITWVANGVLPIGNNIVSPPDLDNTQPVSFKVYAAMSAGTDTCTCVLGFFEGVGGATIITGGNTIAVHLATPAVYTQTATAVAVAGTPLPWGFTFTPGAHANDSLLLYAAWLEYTRK
jgi:hypothetical protein